MTALLFGNGMLSRYWNDLLHWINHLDRQGWFVVLCIVLILGALCLRGFGSRSHY